MRIAMILSLAVLNWAAWSGDDVAHSKDPAAEIKASVDEGKAVIVDVREKDEWDIVHLKSAKLLPLSQVKSGAAKTDDLPKDKPVYLHCRSGKRCLDAAVILKKQGFDVRPVTYSVDDLLGAGFEKAP